MEMQARRLTEAGEITVTIRDDGFVRVEHRIEERFGDHVDVEREWVELQFGSQSGPVVIGAIGREPETAFSTGSRP